MRGMPFNTEKIITQGVDGIEYQDTFWDDMLIPAGSLFSGGGVAPTAIAYKNSYIYMVLMLMINYSSLHKYLINGK